MKNVPLGEPGLGPDGTPAKAYDQTPYARRALSYQDYAAYALLLRSIDGEPYSELWIEHHEDILATREDGRYDLYQVKTRASGDPWTTKDRSIHEAIARFCVVESAYGGKVAHYFIYSNVGPYVPVSEAKVERKLRSFKILQHELSLSSPDQLLPEYAEAFQTIEKASGASQGVVLAVLSKLGFVPGPSLASFRAELPARLCEARRKLLDWTIKDVFKLEDELIRLIEAAGSAKVPPLLLHTSPISAGGLPSAEISARRISTLTIRSRVSRRMIQRKTFRLLKTCGKVAVCMVFGGLVFKPLLQVTPLQHALNVIQNSGGGVLPAEFNDSVAIVRAAHKPLTHLNLDGANIECRDLSDLSMIRAYGQSMHATGATFDRSILASAVFSQSELNGAKFRRARMDHVIFQKSNMLAANLFAAEARHSNFSEATLNAANLSGGFFAGADFSAAKLDSSEMSNADFANTNLKGTVLTDANVSGANFTGARNLTQAMLSSACVVDGKFPTVDEPLRPTAKPCYTTPVEKEQRQIKRMVLLAVGQLAVSHGYCKEFQHNYRSSNSTLHPENNEMIWYGDDEIEGPSMNEGMR